MGDEKLQIFISSAYKKYLTEWNNRQIMKKAIPPKKWQGQVDLDSSDSENFLTDQEEPD